MPIDYHMFGTKLVNQKGYMARVMPSGKLNRKKLIEKMANRGTTLTRTDIKAVLGLFEEVILEALLSGDRVNLDGFINFGVSISGSYERPDNRDREVSAKNLKLNVTPSRTFLKELRAQAKLRRRSEKSRVPIITSVNDLASKTKDEILTRGRQVIIRGGLLGFDDSLDDEGIFIYYVETKKSVRLEYGDSRQFKKLKVLIPLDLESSDNVVLEVRSRLGTKTIRTGRVEGLALV